MAAICLLSAEAVPQPDKSAAASITTAAVIIPEIFNVIVLYIIAKEYVPMQMSGGYQN